jgi:hypothetical protein
MMIMMMTMMMTMIMMLPFNKVNNDSLSGCTNLRIEGRSTKLL